MTDNDDDYTVGYKKPPRDKQFKAGEIHNPNGRPKKRPSIRSELEKELGALTTVKEGNTDVEISKLRAILKAQVKAAIEGNQRAAATVLALYAKIHADDDENISLEEIELLDTYREDKLPNPDKD